MLPTLRDKKVVRLIILGVSIFLGVIFLTAGLVKLIDFPVVISPVWLEQRAAEYGLGLLARFMAFSEAIVGSLLLFPFATLGAIMFFSLMLCILMFAISLGRRGRLWYRLGIISC